MSPQVRSHKHTHAHTHEATTTITTLGVIGVVVGCSRDQVQIWKLSKATLLSHIVHTPVYFVYKYFTVYSKQTDWCRLVYRTESMKRACNVDVKVFRPHKAITVCQ